MERTRAEKEKVRMEKLNIEEQIRLTREDEQVKQGKLLRKKEEYSKVLSEQIESVEERKRQTRRMHQAEDDAEKEAFMAYERKLEEEMLKFRLK